jgi:hypothetical protein
MACKVLDFFRDTAYTPLTSYNALGISRVQIL